MFRRANRAPWALLGGLVAVLWAAGGSPAQAQWTPSKEVLMVTHSAPGSGNDLVLRQLAQIWKETNLLPVGTSIENVQGGGGLKARLYVVKQKDGDDHVLWSYTPPQLIRPLLRNEEINYKNMTTIAMLAVEPQVIAVNTESEFKTLKDLVEFAKANPEKLIQGGGPFGNSASIAGEQLKTKYDLKIPYTPFQGGGEAVIQLLGKHVDFVIESPSEMREHVQAGTLRLLASTESLSAFPDVPTFADSGYAFEDQKAFRAIMAPPNISPEARAYYIDLLDKTRQTQQWKDYLNREMLAEFWMSGDEVSQYLEREGPAQVALLKKLGVSDQ